MAVKVNDTDGSVVAVDGAQQRKSDSVVTTKSDQARQSSSLLGWARLVSMGVGRTTQEKVVALLNLLERKSVVVTVVLSVFLSFIAEIDLYSRGDWNISTVNDLCPRVEWVCFQWNIVSATKSNPA